MKKLRKLSLILIFSLFLFFSFVIINTQDVQASNIITVGPDGPPAYDYSKIIDAISNANENDTINVYGGTYSENIVIYKSINIVSISGSSSTIIINANENKNTIEITANNVSINGFTIKNFVGTTFACIKFNSVHNCTISNNNIKHGGNGVYLIDSFNNKIDHNNINNNNVGIYFSNADLNIIKYNNIQYNNQNGVFVYLESINNRFYQNQFSNNDGNALDYCTNNWNYTSEGNYWDDYNDYDTDGDGIGDNPYIISGSGNNIDHYPLGYFLSLNQEPVAYIDSINPNPAKYDDIITFTGHGSDDGPIISWEWKSDGTIISTSKIFSTSSLSPGNHSISFRVKDNDGVWSDYVYQILVINPNIKPTAYILKPAKSTFYFGEPIEFYGYGIDPDGNIEAYLWRSAPNELYSEDYSFNKSDLTIGDYIVYFKVRDNKGEWSSEISINLKILPNKSTDNLPPLANPGGPYYGYINELISFNGSKSYDPDEGDTLTYNWDFGDNETGSGLNPKHIYKSQGNYIVKLTVTDKEGAKSNNSTQVFISLKPNTQNEKETTGFEFFLIFIATLILVIWNKHKKST